MSATCHLFSEHDELRITADAEGAVWIRGQHTTVSLTLSQRDLRKLQAASALLCESDRRDDVEPVRDMAAEAAQAVLRG